MEPVLSRVNLEIPLPQWLERLASIYDLGDVKGFETFQKGYEDCNLKLKTSKGVFVVKLFSKEKPFILIQDYLKVLSAFAEAQVPAPRLVRGKEGFLYSYAGNYALVMEFFEGKSFEELKSADRDIKTLIACFARIHQLPLQIHPNYDSWGTAHFMREFDIKKGHLSPADLKMVKPVAEGFFRIPWSVLPKGIIHGDLQRAHVLKNKKGKYCILDLGCLDYNALILDLAIFIALFCFELKSKKADEKRYALAIREYNKIRPLNPSELQVLPLLIKATYASYLMAANEALKIKKDKSQQTQAWFALSRKGINQCDKMWK